VSAGRVVTLVLQSEDGSIVGTLAPFSVELPWWSEATEVVEAAQRERGADVTVLRLLHAEADPENPWKMGGTAVYAAELHGVIPPGLLATDDQTTAAAREEHPLRLPWARPGGPARELDWAAHALAESGRELTGRPRQMRTWNLSSIWSIPTNTGTAWLKSVPSFFAHEGRIIAWLADPSLPPLLAWTEGRVLMDDIAGEDQYDAALPTLVRAVDILVAMQDRVRGHTEDLLALGLPDWRWRALRPRIDDVVDRHRHELDGDHARVLDAFVARFDERCAAIDACGLPTTLVHGDFHPGNLRGDDSHLVLLDWGDCGVGHPLLDVPAMLRTLAFERAGPIMAAWVARWLERCPGSDPRRAAALIEPVAALRCAVTFRSFLDRIEPSERCYHDGDPALWLRRAAEALRRSPER
jgi:Ser/Thr protein kinase RdoA (MazF antagonist)